MVTDGRAPSSLLSMHWYRIANLKPKLAPDVAIQRRFTRNRHWYVLSRDDHAGQVRLNNAAWAVVGRCNGLTDLASIWQRMALQEPDRLPSQQDLLPLLASLIKQGILICEDWPDLDQRDKDHRENARRQGLQKLNPLAPRLPLGDPSRVIARLAPIGRVLLSPAGFAAIAVLTVLALLTVWQHWHTLSETLVAASGTARFWLISWCVYPLIKAVHELAHGMVLQHYGGRTRVFGISLLMFMPAPYVDASETEQLSSGRERALVSAAGILAEIILAAIAIIAWAWLSHGLLSEVLLAVALIGSVSTVTFNANPLIRFDGYYVLTDLSGLTNLAERSKAFWQKAMQKTVLGMPTRALATGGAERGWLIAYAPASWLYRMAILLWLAGWLGSYSRAAGLVVIVLAVVMLILMPVIRLIQTPIQAGLPLTGIGMAQARFGLALCALLAFGWLPVPDRTLVQAVTWAPDGARIRVTQPGFVEAINANDGKLVMPGEPLVQMLDPQLDAEIHAQIAQISGLENEWLDELTKHSEQLTGRREMLAQAYRRLDHLQQNKARLTLYAATAGRFRLTDPAEDLPGRFVSTGHLLALLETSQPVRLRAVLTESQANRVRKQPGEKLLAQVRNNNGQGSPMAARIVSLSPDAIDALPSRALARSNGGTIETAATASADVESGDADKPLRPGYQLELQLAQAQSSAIIADNNDESRALIPGQRVWVRLDLGWRPLVSQLVESAGQAFNARMAPGWS